MGFKVNLKCFI